MAQEQTEIRQHIADTRRQIDANVDTLTQEMNERIATLRDWRRPLREHALALLGAGLAGGLILGWVVGD